LPYVGANVSGDRRLGNAATARRRLPDSHATGLEAKPGKIPNAKLSFIAKQPAPSGRPEVTNCRVEVTAIPDGPDFTQALIDELFKAPAPPEMAQEIASTIFGDPSIRENRLVRVSNQPAFFISISGSYESLNAKVYGEMAMVELMHRRQTYVIICGAMAADLNAHSGHLCDRRFLGIPGQGAGESGMAILRYIDSDGHKQDVDDVNHLHYLIKSRQSGKTA
jgi:hypothetical protein